MTAPLSTWWSEEEEKKLKWMRNRGMTYRHIAHALGRTCGAVSNRACVLGLSRQKPQNWPAPVNRSAVCTHGRLSDYYAIGWRVVSFDADGVDLNWPHASDPRYPEAKSPTRDFVNIPELRQEVAA